MIWISSTQTGSGDPIGDVSGTATIAESDETAHLLDVDRANNELTLGGNLTTIIAPSKTASRMLALDADKKLASVADLTSWVDGTTNRITVADDGDGTITLSGPQDMHTGASPTFAGATLTDFSGLVHATAGVLSAGGLYVAEYKALLIVD